MREIHIPRPLIDWTTAPTWADLWSYRDGKAWWHATSNLLDVSTLDDVALGTKREITTFSREQHAAPTFGWTGRNCAEPRPEARK